mgnify:CR=1 FL=1
MDAEKIDLMLRMFPDVSRRDFLRTAAAGAATLAAVSSAISSLRSYARAVRGSSTATVAGSPTHAPSSSATRSPISESRAIHTIRSPDTTASAAAR